MKRELFSGFLVISLLITMLGLAFNVRLVKADETIYIRPNGDVDPPTAPIQRDADVYTFTGNNSDSIAVERSNITIDGKGYTVQGTEAYRSKGIDLTGRSNVTIKNMNIRAFDFGIYLYFSSYTSVSGNNITNNTSGIFLNESSFNSVSGNNITANNGIGIFLEYFSSFNSVSENNITNNGNGILFYNSSFNSVSGNNITANNGIGIRLIDASNNSVSGNNVTANSAYGISIAGSIISSDSISLVVYASNNSVSGNNITNNDWGITLSIASYTSVSGNNITNDWGGITLYYSSYNSISGNNVAEDGFCGIEVYYSSFNSVSGNNITANIGKGICLGLSASYNSVSGNNITNNTGGITLGDSSYNSISGNKIANNDYGIEQSETSYSNKVYHNNLINNTNQVYDFFRGWLNVWDDGYPSGGNYWSDYNGTDVYSGPYQNVTGSDGIWDDPYVIDANNTDHYPLVNPWIPKADLVVRGMDDRIYYRVWNGAGWEGWNVLPGSTMDSAAAAILGNQLHVVVRGSDGNSLWHGYLSNQTDPTSFVGWTLLDGATSSAPTLTSNGTALCLVVRGLNNRIYLRCYIAGSWGSWHAVPTGATCDSPALAMLGNNLHIVVRGMDQSSLWDTIVRCDGTVVRDWMSISGATPSKPVLACSSADSLCLVVRGMDNAIYYRSYTGFNDSWEGWSAVPTGASCDGPAAAMFLGELHIIVRGMDGCTMWHGYVDVSAGSFMGWALIDGATESPPTLTS